MRSIFTYLLPVLMVANVAITAPTPAGSTSEFMSARPRSADNLKCTTETDKFDNVTVLTPITYQNGLRYIDFIAQQPLTDDITGVVTESSSNAAGASTITDAAGTGSVTLSPFGILTTDGTSTKYFKLVDFYYACLGTPTGTGVPEGCVVEVHGVDINGNKVGSASYSFLPTDENVMGMNRAILPAYFALLKSVTFTASTFTVTGGTTFMLLDNVRHTNCV